MVLFQDHSRNIRNCTEKMSLIPKHDYSSVGVQEFHPSKARGSQYRGYNGNKQPSIPRAPRSELMCSKREPRDIGSWLPQHDGVYIDQNLTLAQRHAMPAKQRAGFEVLNSSASLSLILATRSLAQDPGGAPHISWQAACIHL